MSATIMATPDLRALVARDLLADTDRRLLSLIKSLDVAENSDSTLSLNPGFHEVRTHLSEALYALSLIGGW